MVSGLRDPELPVRVDSVFALRSFVEACRGMLQLIFFKIFLSFSGSNLKVVPDGNLCSPFRFE